jgi:hypothetical protein
MQHRLADQTKTRLRILIRVLAACSGTATAVGGALARSHGSDLLPLRLPFVHRPAVPFVASPALREVSRALPKPRALPGPDALFVPSLDGFGLARAFAPRQSRLRRAGRSSNRMPSGQLRFGRVRNQPGVLDSTWSGFSSLLAAKPLIRGSDGARTPPEGLVSSASPPDHFQIRTRGDRPTSLACPFPSCLGLSRNRLRRPRWNVTQRPF